ncbi:Dcp1-like decapping [Kalmanozyma brasiliensis GHG001]|uniref:Decapping enzyme n=1 Tax=Kalmanozyma brasiliensis (strain GHG001) TaxID=1365824 RepID=V5E4U7_KALBG|nr:Dcp1-like decapping [Kalmanozyma brasiliensis GHG001]EST05236.1 Dcp1-like decapping [Kalmanozyma brasiliensis GHG001]
MASTAEARSSFNLKVLRRHDPSIVSIFETASFVVLYNYNNGEWTKTGVEGPLFLFRRRLPPYNGFFLMNRNGVENFSADVTPDDDLEITPEFIIYRPEANDEVYGIWVFEPGQRMSVGDKLLRLQQMVEAPSAEVVRVAEQSSSAAGESKQAEKKNGKETEAKGGKGKVNGKPKRNAKQTTTAPLMVEKDSADEASSTPAPSAIASTDSEVSRQINLDDLFGSSAPASTPAQSGEESTEKEAAPQAASNGANLLDSLFQNAVSLDNAPSNTAPATEASKSVAEPTPATHSQNLLALLGGPSTSAPTATTEPSEPPKPTTPPPQPEPTSATSGGAPKMSELIEQAIRDRIGLGDDGQPLSRREFVTELLSMVHTNPDFVSELYNSYVSRVS